MHYNNKRGRETFEPLIFKLEILKSVGEQKSLDNIFI